MSDKVKPRLSKGLRDLLPEQMLARQRMIDTIRGVYERYGFVPLHTPAIEYLDVLTGSDAGSEAQQSIFTVNNPEKEKLGLRFDLTVPLARVVAQYRELPRPFRRYQVSPVWRADKPDKGRFREFTQFDLDSVGVVSEIADTEIIAGMCDTLTALDVGPYEVRFSSRTLLNLLLSHADIPRKQGADVFRVLDKLDKLGMKKVRLELTGGYTDTSGDPIKGLGLAAAQVDRIEQFLAIKAKNRKEVFTRLYEFFSDLENAEKEISAVEKISDQLYLLGYDNDRVVFDLSIARGLAYYTGPVFEAVLLDAPEFGTIFGGGRYDGLVMRFLGEKVPATGASIGVDRLLAALEHLGRFDARKSTSRVLVTNMDPDLTDDCLAMTFELRRAGIPSEMYLAGGRRFGKQIKYADAWGISLCVLYGSDEKDRGVVTIKDMEVGRAKAGHLEGRDAWLEERPGQREVARDDLLTAVREMLDRIDAPRS